jgi:hypothetical protein
MSFEPIRTLAELNALDQDEIAEGYRDARRGDQIEPGANRGRAYWHGWRCRMMDLGLIEIDADHGALVAEVVADMRAKDAEAMTRRSVAAPGKG